jgi:hypothetical protein
MSKVEGQDYLYRQAYSGTGKGDSNLSQLVTITG